MFLPLIHSFSVQKEIRIEQSTHRRPCSAAYHGSSNGSTSSAKKTSSSFRVTLSRRCCMDCLDIMALSGHTTENHSCVTSRSRRKNALAGLLSMVSSKVSGRKSPLWSSLRYLNAGERCETNLQSETERHLNIQLVEISATDHRANEPHMHL